MELDHKVLARCRAGWPTFAGDGVYAQIHEIEAKLAASFPQPDLMRQFNQRKDLVCQSSLAAQPWRVSVSDRAEAEGARRVLGSEAAAARTDRLAQG